MKINWLMHAVLGGLLLSTVTATARSLPDGPYISTSAVAVEEVAPDYASIDLAFHAVEPTMEAARARVDEAQRRLIGLLEPYADGLGDWRVDSMRFGEHWEYEYPQRERHQAGFFGEFRLALKITDFNRLATLHYALAGLEWQALGNPRFELADPEAAEAAARRRALELATDRARRLAEAGGARLGSIWGVISEPMHQLAGDGAFGGGGSGSERVQMMGRQASDAFALPVGPTPVRIEARVGVVFALEPDPQ